jgi:DNA-binding response OmpR family regulator
MMIMRRIAIIDNDADVVFLLNEVFHDHHWDVLSARRVDAAVELIRNEWPDVVLLDLWLDGPVNGWDLLRYLKGDSATSSIPVIVCSGAIAELRDRADWLRGHGIDVIYKPFDLDEVEAAVARSFSPPRATSEGAYL